MRALAHEGMLSDAPPHLLVLLSRFVSLLCLSGVDMLLLAPVREELTFRGLMFTIFYLRGVAFKTAQPAPTPAVSDATTDATTAVVATTEESLAWTSSWKVDCIIASAVTFGFVHLLNLFGDRFTRTYIILQVFLGMTLGTFYCLRFVLSENAMLETVILHMINNFFSRSVTHMHMRHTNNSARTHRCRAHERGIKERRTYQQQRL